MNDFGLGVYLLVLFTCSNHYSVWGESPTKYDDLFFLSRTHVDNMHAHVHKDNTP